MIVQHDGYILITSGKPPSRNDLLTRIAGLNPKALTWGQGLNDDIELELFVGTLEQDARDRKVCEQARCPKLC